jgi:hypothetical protein
MTAWTIDLEAILRAPDTDIESVAESLLDTLHELHEVMGPVAYLNLAERTIGVRFDLEAKEVREATDKGIDLVVVAIEQAQIEGIELHRGAIEQSEPTYNAAQDKNLVHA